MYGQRCAAEAWAGWRFGAGPGSTYAPLPLLSMQLQLHSSEPPLYYLCTTFALPLQLPLHDLQPHANKALCAAWEGADTIVSGGADSQLRIARIPTAAV